MGTLKVLVVEDDPVAVDAHAEYVTRVPGFGLAGQAATGTDALRLLAHREIDLVLLDMRLPDLHGLDVVRRMRASGNQTDVIAVTAARDLTVVRGAVSQGIVLYLLKPFLFATFRDKLERYQAFRTSLAAGGAVAGQHQVDQMLARLRGADVPMLPKGMSLDSLNTVVDLLRASGQGISAGEAATALGMSRVTARRYLEHLVNAELVERRARYGGTGRPVLEFQWIRPSAVESTPTLTPADQ
ncbi:response regulator [Parafrankia sp. FMc2]|uniref:response regulator n=1 Tax=Parafrankia sp. FMc2 TaxID=3233196 RepID=UPI0034D6D519